MSKLLLPWLQSIPGIISEGVPGVGAVLDSLVEGVNAMRGEDQLIAELDQIIIALYSKIYVMYRTVPTCICTCMYI